MESLVLLERANDLGSSMPRKTRQRRPLAPQAARDWLTPNETALVLGCSVATVHRLRRGLISGGERLPFCQYGRKIVFRKQSIAGWRERNETGRLAA
jgi:hypothetical protein